MNGEPQEYLDVRVYTPEGVLWEGKARSVSSVNSQGPFDLLPEHAHFVSFIEKEPIVIVTEDGKQETLRYDTAVIRLFNDNVRIYVEDVTGLRNKAISGRRDT